MNLELSDEQVAKLYELIPCVESYGASVLAWEALPALLRDRATMTDRIAALVARVKDVELEAGFVQRVYEQRDQLRSTNAALVAENERLRGALTTLTLPTDPTAPISVHVRTIARVALGINDSAALAATGTPGDAGEESC